MASYRVSVLAGCCVVNMGYDWLMGEGYGYLSGTGLADRGLRVWLTEICGYGLLRWGDGMGMAMAGCMWAIAGCMRAIAGFRMGSNASCSWLYGKGYSWLNGKGYSWLYGKGYSWWHEKIYSAIAGCMGRAIAGRMGRTIAGRMGMAIAGGMGRAVAGRMGRAAAGCMGRGMSGCRAVYIWVPGTMIDYWLAHVYVNLCRWVVESSHIHIRIHIWADYYRG